MTDFLSYANGPVMWLFSVMCVSMVFAVSVLVYRQVVRFSREHGLLSKEEIRSSLKTGGVVAFGPAMAVFIVAIAMIANLGAPVTLMRIGIIGSASTEIVAASVGAEIYGTELGADDYSLSAFAASLFSMAFMSFGYLLCTPIFTRFLTGTWKRKTKAKKEISPKVQKTIKGLLALFPAALIIGVSVMLIMRGTPYFMSLLAGFTVMLCLRIVAGYTKIQWIREWAFGFAVLLGMTTGYIFS